MYLSSDYLYSLESWKHNAPPMGGDKQWKEGRSALELAKYMTAHFPQMPPQLNTLLSDFTSADATFQLYAEYVTKFDASIFGKGEGRNHDAVLFNNDIFVGIEAKADEPFGRLLSEEITHASDNKMLRINSMLDLFFNDTPQNHQQLRYQLLTASTATILEAEKRKIKNAVLLVIIFKKEGCYQQKKLQINEQDFYRFITETNATPIGEYWKIATKKNIDFYMGKIEVIVA